MDRKFSKRRSSAVILVVAAFLAVFLVRLFFVQVVSANETGQTTVKNVTVSVEPLRGEIRDRNGDLLVTNKQVNTIIFDYLRFPPGNDPQSRNSIILELLKLFERNKAEWIDNLPIVVTRSGKLAFAKDKENEIAYLKSKAFLHLNPYASVQNCFDALAQRYSLEDYDLEDARNIASVYYSMHKEGFNSSVQYVFASDVSDSLVAAIKEQNDVFVGVDVKVVAQRDYVDGDIAPHILGLVGAISPDEYEAKQSEGYGKNDVIGKSGIELYLEKNLRGTPGTKTITTDSDGNSSETYSVYPVQGDTVILTIDKGVQKVAQDSLRSLILQQQVSRANVTSGAVVVMDTRNNDILACASYPTFDATTYSEHAAELNRDTAKPLWNRALRSTYTPGSTIKPAVAMAGLEEGIINDDYVVYCNGIYRYYEDYQPGCTGFHGGQDVVHALYNSCNIFFYETSRLLGIEKLNSYFAMFGLGQKTGVELGESEGTIDSFDFRKSKGEIWTPGLTIQAGIGHGDNQFTPVQLCSYVSTIANRGIRYKAHFIKSVMSSDFSETKLVSENEVLSRANFKDENWDKVYQGMLLVGTKSYADFTKVPVKVAAKTGTTTIEKRVKGGKIETYNGLIMTFAPYENPEIAIAVVIEGAGSGGSTAPVASAIMEYYFSTQDNRKTTQKQATLLK